MKGKDAIATERNLTLFADIEKSGDPLRANRVSKE